MNNLKTVKGLWTKKYSVVMIKDKSGSYLISATNATDKSPVVKVNTTDYLYATRLFDSMLENLNTI